MRKKTNYIYEGKYKSTLERFEVFRKNKLFDSSREKAYEDCRIAYIKACNGAITSDELAKDVFLYLLNWGMGRNSVLMNLNYTALGGLAKTLIEEKKSVFQKTMGAEEVIRLKRLVDNELKHISVVFYGENDTEKIGFKSITDTLSSKILLGTTGCILAYDNNVLENLITKTFNEKSVRELQIFLATGEMEEKITGFCQRMNEYVEKQTGIGGVYTPMRALDICLWSK